MFNYLDFSFPITSLPIILVCIGPFAEALYATFILKRNESGIDEKIIGGLVSLMGIACIINYGLNRFNPTPLQYLIGFGSGFVCYLIHSILLPIYCIQQINRKKTDVLEAMVKEKTKELLTSKEEKEKLLAVLMHDISNPLYSATYFLQKALKDHEYDRIDSSLKSLKFY